MTTGAGEMTYEEPAARGQRGALTGGPVASLFLVLASVLVWVAVATKAPSDVRAPVVFMFSCVAPGWAVMRLLRLPTVTMEMVCSLLVSTSLVVIGASAMTLTGAWRPFWMSYSLLAFTIVFAVVGLGWQVAQLTDEVEPASPGEPPPAGDGHR